MSHPYADADASRAAASGTTPVAPIPERTIGQLVADASHDLSTIVRGEIQLAKAEVTSGMKVAGKGAGMLAAAGVLALLGLIFLLHTIAWVLDLWLPIWAGYLIVAGVLLVVGGILAMVGLKAVKKAKPMPGKAIKNAQETFQVLKSAG